MRRCFFSSTAGGHSVIRNMKICNFFTHQKSMLVHILKSAYLCVEFASYIHISLFYTVVVSWFDKRTSQCAAFVCRLSLKAVHIEWSVLLKDSVYIPLADHRRSIATTQCSCIRIYSICCRLLFPVCILCIWQTCISTPYIDGHANHMLFNGWVFFMILHLCDVLQTNFVLEN